jgi:hypothetical protein
MRIDSAGPSDSISSIATKPAGGHENGQKLLTTEKRYGSTDVLRRARPGNPPRVCGETPLPEQFLNNSSHSIWLSAAGDISVAYVFVFATMALHFLVNDVGLQGHYKHRYQSTGRWLLSAAVPAGWATGFSIDNPDLTVTRWPSLPAPSF